MPKARWGIESSDVDDYDRSNQYMPYDGPIPPDAVYEWQIKVLKRVAGTATKNPQLRVGLELAPREDRDEEQYNGYFRMDFIPINDKTTFRYVPFLDAIGVTGREFTNGTVMDEEGNIKKIGKWRNTGEEYIRAQLKTGEDQNGAPTKQIGVYMPLPDEDEEDADYDDDDEYEDDPV